jgi:predicted NBD/HSP70 family sugar kinase
LLPAYIPQQRSSQQRFSPDSFLSCLKEVPTLLAIVKLFSCGEIIPATPLEVSPEVWDTCSMRISDSELNRLQVLKAIRRAEPVARTDLVKLTGLAAGTISQVTADFVRRGLLIEEKASGKTLGRPRIELRIDAAAGYVLSVFDNTSELATIEIVDLRGDPVFTYSAKLERVESMRTRAGQLAALIDEAIDASPLSKAQIYRVGVVVRGMVDSARGVVHWLATYPETGVPFASLIEEQVQIPVVIDNDTNVIARAEHWFGEDPRSDDFAAIIVDLALNAGFYAGGMLWAGAHGINSELGHIKIGGGESRSCYCGMRGCLATYCAIFGIVARICEKRGLPAPDLQYSTPLFSQFAAEALAGEPVSREVFDQAGRMLGLAVANMLNERDPGPIIVMCFEPDIPRLIGEAFYAALKANTLTAVFQGADVRFKVIDADHYRKGAATLALEQIYRS